MKVLVVNNLASGYGEGAIYDFIRAFTSDGDEITLRSTDGTCDLASLVHDAQSFDIVVASGGDGTVSSVSYALAGSAIPILPFPAGTANLLCLNLSQPSEPHALARIARESMTLDFDLGEIIVDETTYGFAIMAGAGYDATIMKGAQPHKRLLGPMAYFQAAVTNPLPQHSHITIEMDENRVIRSEGLGILVVNFSKIQFDLSVTHKNRPRDGYLDIAIMKTENAFGLLPVLGAVFLDRSGGNPDRTAALELHRAKHVRVSADPPLMMQYDGEVTGITTPFSVQILPKAARYILGPEGYRQFSGEDTGDVS